MLEPFPAQQDQLVLGEGRVHVRQRDAVERQVPGREPRVLPLVRHRHDVERVEVAPPRVPARQPLRRAASAASGPRPASGPRRSRTAACSTASRRTPAACTKRLVGGRPSRRELGVELVGLGPPLGDDLAEQGAERGRPPVPWVPGRALAAAAAAARRCSPAPTVTWYQNAALVPVRSGLTVAAPLTTWSLMPSFGYGVDGAAPNRRWSFVSFSQNTAVGSVPSGPGPAMSSIGPMKGWSMPTDRVTHRLHRRLGRAHVPGPGVAEPDGRQHMQRGGLRARVRHLDGHEQIVGAGLGVVHLGDPVPIVVEHPGIEQLVLRLLAVTRPVLLDEVLIGKRGLRIVIPPPVPRMARQRVQVPPVLLDILAVIALRAGQPERPLLQDRILAVPQRQAQA